MIESYMQFTIIEKQQGGESMSKYIQRLDKSVFFVFTLLWLLLVAISIQLLDIPFNGLTGTIMGVVSILLSICTAVFCRKQVIIQPEYINFGMKKYRWEEIQRISYEQFVRTHEGGVTVDQYLVFEMRHRQKRLSIKGLEHAVVSMILAIQAFHPTVQLCDHLRAVVYSDSLHLHDLAREAKQKAEKELEEYYTGKKEAF
jgi:hypothetical protein